MIPTLFILGLCVCYNFIPNYFDLMNADGNAKFLRSSSNITQVNYPPDHLREHYEVTAVYFQNNT